MKKMMMIAAMMVATLSANAQFEPGTFSLQPKAGLTVSEITGDDTRAKAGFTAGVEAQYQMKSWFGLAAGVQYAQQGSKVKGVDPKISLGYINVPIMAKFYPVKGLALNADVNIKDNCNTFDFSIPFSVAYEAPFGLVIEARYNAGLTNVGKDIFKNGNYDTYDKITKNKNSVFMLTLGYKFSL